MRVTVKVGDVSVAVDGLDFTRRQIVALANHVAGLSAALAQGDDDDRQGFGFSLSAATERAVEPEPESWFTDDEE